ncbi:YdcF family protein [Paenibacillus doosanensis]|nr:MULTISPECIES: YdcF family protein [Paenibacillus]MCS7461173.1 YdcF family protein [Paenibacillus doosanensis]
MNTWPDHLSASGDAGIVLGAALWNGEPSPALKERLDRAALLYKQRRIAHIIVSGGPDRSDSQLTEADGMRSYLLRFGIPDTAVVMERRSTSTYENILFSREIVQRNDWHSTVIITHKYHAPRALDIAKFVGLEHPEVSAVDSKVLMMSWHQSRETMAWIKWELDKLLLLVQTGGRA